MAEISLYYQNTGKTLYADGDSYTIFGRDFNPRQSDIPAPAWDKDTFTASGETSYNLSGFQVGNEVCFCVTVVDLVGFNIGDYLNVRMIFQKYSGGWQNAGWIHDFTYEIVTEDDFYYCWNYVGIDSDEIRPGATRYRFLYQYDCAGEYAEFTKEFTVSNLSFDDSLHPAGYIWVDGASLNFTDASYTSSRGYKHIINPDSSYSASFVGASHAGAVWLPSSSSDDHIYYVDENGYKRRTASSQTWFDEGNDYAGSSKAGYMWVSNGYDAADGYAHLCYVNSNGYKRRISNGRVT